MFTWQRLSNCLLFALLVCAFAFAQEKAPGTRSAASPPITVAAAGAGVRFTALGAVERMRLEVFDPSGTPVFDTGFRPGNVRDWRLTGAHGERPIDGTYLCVVTVKEVSGRLSFKQGSVLVWDGRASPALEGSGQPERVEAEQSFSSRSPAEPAALTALTHDGEVGQVTSTAGALTFRTGDLFTGRDKERLRITEDGKVGIGTDDPQSALDVAGAIRARGGIRFEDGTVLTSTGRAGRTNADGTITDDPTPSVSGTGTTGRLTKWTDGATGELGDSVVTELGGRLGVAVATPRARLDIKQSVDSFVGGLHLRRATTNDTWALVTGSDNNLYMGYATDASGADAGGDFTTFPLVLSAANRVGIGTTAPAAKLHVNGNVNFTGLRTEATASTPNVVGGFSGNTVTAGVVGATISGGGSSGTGLNRVTDDFGTVGGGIGNRAGDGAGATNSRPYATVGGGIANIASGITSTIGGGSDNTASGFDSTVGGGHENIASSNASTVGGGEANFTSGVNSTVSGGRGNHAEGSNSTVGGGGSNFAIGDYSTIGGGLFNQATGSQSTVPGGSSNLAHGSYSFAAGRRAEAVNQGAFVWADSTDAGFGSTDDNQFLIRAGGGVGIGTNSPGATLGLVGASGNANLFMRAAATPTRGINFGVSGSAPNATLFIAQYNGTTYQDRLVINPDGTVSVNLLAAATGTHLCVNGTKLANCSSSRRYKERVAPFNAGLGLLSRLRPVTFKWREREERDLGLIAEEVNRVEPLLVTRDAAGEVQGVKYDQLSVVLINAIREQQGQLERQRKEIEGLKQLVCLTSPRAEVCR